MRDVEVWWQPCGFAAGWDQSVQEKTFTLNVKWPSWQLRNRALILHESVRMFWFQNR
jgi:hypothetical protein